MHPLAGIAAFPCAAEFLLTALLIAAALHGGLGCDATVTMEILTVTVSEWDSIIGHCTKMVLSL